jgi:pimeloyl-ACP methyl ester carboxylesterase
MAYTDVRTYELGPAHSKRLVLPGLPVNADTWTGVLERLSSTRAADLPGLGMTAGNPDDWRPWLEEIVTSGHVRRLVGHSIGTAPALDFAARHPDRIEQLTLIAPFFLQAPIGAAPRFPAITRPYLRHVRPEALSRRLTGSEVHADTLRGVVADLQRGRTASHSARLLRKSAGRPWRALLQQQLVAYPGRVHLVVGSEDPLAPWAAQLLEPLGSRLTTTTMDGAGHHPQLTHPAILAAALAPE